MSTSHQLSRFQIIEGNPQQPPYGCSVCGGQEGTFIDFGLDLEFYGTVYLCLNNCIRQLANELGYRSHAQHQVALDAVETQRSIANRALDKVKELEDVLGAYHRVSNYSGPARDHFHAESQSSEYKQEPAETEPESPRQGTKWGRSDVQSDDGLDKFFGLD